CGRGYSWLPSPSSESSPGTPQSRSVAAARRRPPGWPPVPASGPRTPRPTWGRAAARRPNRSLHLLRPQAWCSWTPPFKHKVRPGEVLWPGLFVSFRPLVPPPLHHRDVCGREVGLIQVVTGGPVLLSGLVYAPLHSGYGQCGSPPSSTDGWLTVIL